MIFKTQLAVDGFSEAEYGSPTPPQPTKTFLVFSYVYGISWLLSAIITLLRGATHVVLGLLNASGGPESLGEVVGFGLGLAAASVAMIYCAVAILRRQCNKTVLRILYCLCGIDALKVILHGVVPLEMLAWLIFGLWPVLYLHSKLKVAVDLAARLPQPSKVSVQKQTTSFANRRRRTQARLARIIKFKNYSTQKARGTEKPEHSDDDTFYSSAPR